MTNTTPAGRPQTEAATPDARRAERRHKIFQAETHLGEQEYISTTLDMPFLPLQVHRPPHPAHPHVIVRSPTSAALDVLTHPIYFIDPHLVELQPTDGAIRERYVLRIHRLLAALGLLDDRGAPSRKRVEEAAGGPLTVEELRAHQQGLPSRLDRVYFTASDLRIPLTQHLEQVWEELAAIDPDGNARLAQARTEQLAALESAADSVAAIRAATAAHELLTSLRKDYEARTGLADDQYHANLWGYPFVPHVQPRHGDTAIVLIQAPVQVLVSFLGHPAFWCDPGITAFRNIDGNSSRYCVRMFLTFQALGLIGPDREPRDMLESLGAEASATHRRNHLRGRPTPLDDVYITWDKARDCNARQVLEQTWATLAGLDPEGNALLADAWQEQLDEWAHQDYLAAKAAAAQAQDDAVQRRRQEQEQEQEQYRAARAAEAQEEADRAARKRQRQQKLLSTVDAAVRALERRDERTANKAHARDEAEKRLARQLYIEQSRRRR